MKKFYIKIVAVILIVFVSAGCLFACDMPESLTDYNYKTELPIETATPKSDETESAVVDEIRGEFISKEIIDGLTYSIYEKGVQLNGFVGGKEKAHVVIPARIKDKDFIGVGDRAFYNKKILESIKLPESTKYIGISAFIYCENLKMDSLPNGVEYVGTKAFSYCKNIKKMDFPSSVRFLGEYIFAAAGITEVMIPEQITKVPVGMFFDTQIAEINIPSHVDSIGVNAFARCNLVESLVIPGNVVSIDEKAFYYNQNLKTIVVEEGLKELTYGVFGGCISLEKITLPKSIAHYDVSIFTECPQKFIVCGYEDSKAEEFATNKKYEFEYIEK